MSFREMLENKEFIFLDGAMGTMLQAKGMKMGAIPELLNLEKPEWIVDIHKQYIAAGANVIYANTFGANAYKLKGCGHSVTEVIQAGVQNARKACEGTDTLVALDIGPIGQLLEPTGTLTFEEAYEIYKEQLLAGKDADLVVFETQTDLYELKAAVLAAKENTTLPVACSMTFEKNHRTFTGCGISNMALTLDGLGVDAMGINCSLGPVDLYPVVEELAKLTNTPILVKPNAGLPDPVTNTYDISPEEFAKQLSKFADYGVQIVGGCCGTSPDYIKEVVKIFDGIKRTEVAAEVGAAVCSATETVFINQPRIIGERINPTGKKRFKEALLNQDIDYILNQAIEQTKAGAEILDVNVGLPGVDEKQMMIRAVKAIQSINEAPLQIDSTIPEVLEAALRVYNGKPIVNSVNGEKKSLETVLPLVKKYGAAVVGLTLDENGIPKSADERFEIAKRILNAALALGIRKEDVYIDCLTLTASAEQDGVMETLKAVYRVKHELGLKTVLGVSNISFGLPGRELVNHTFLAMALTNGLDLPIINPNVAAMSGTVFAYRVLAGYDRNSVSYIDAYNQNLQYMLPAKSAVKEPLKSAVTGDSGLLSGNGKPDENTLEYAIENGLKNDGARITREMLAQMDSMQIINEHLIPSLDKVGSAFEKGTIFLPQLIMAADVAQAAFGVIKEEMSKQNTESVNKGSIVLATVKGDIHDIGKNIVKVLLENYGYQVIDLGKDVDYQLVADTAKEKNIKLVGLSALMTTTLVSMEKTIQLLRKEVPDCKIMVGGAVLTPDYAKKIGADFYSKDAKESVDIAKKVFG
ncbi:MAG: homocysteine S-methyltransferase family protein [Lachnospiraceae bacterium]|nr:homocysteine S-methyltransferase family protein [Lachnospiraceae bacterium]